ncbi:MAG: FtsL-like putative cell division protein [Rikenellaceae bacterium]
MSIPNQRVRPSRTPSRPTQKRRRRTEQHQVSARGMVRPKPKEKKPSKIVNTYIPRMISDMSTGGFFKRYNLDRYYIWIVALTVCSTIYIANTFSIHKLYYQETKLNEQLKELRAKSLSFAAIKMSATRESAIYEQIVKRNIPLVYPKTPPLVIEVPQKIQTTIAESDNE